MTFNSGGCAFGRGREVVCPFRDGLELLVTGGAGTGDNGVDLAFSRDELPISDEKEKIALVGAM